MYFSFFPHLQDKCAKYWPDEGDPKYFDEINVKLRSESVIGEYIVRVLDLSRVCILFEIGNESCWLANLKTG